jgi:hypothetical protein
MYNKMDVAGFFRRNQAVKNGHEIWNLECQESMQDMIVENGKKGINKVKFIFLGDVGGH